MSKTYSLLTKPLRKSGETDAPAKWSDISYGPGGGVFACLGPVEQTANRQGRRWF